jgi:hypothetical protein
MRHEGKSYAQGRARAQNAGGGAHPLRQAAAGFLSARIVGRHAPTRDDCAHARLQAKGPARGRADHHARRSPCRFRSCCCCATCSASSACRSSSSPTTSAWPWKSATASRSYMPTRSWSRASFATSCARAHPYGRGAARLDQTWRQARRAAADPPRRATLARPGAAQLLLLHRVAALPRRAAAKPCRPMSESGPTGWHDVSLPRSTVAAT